MSKKSTTASLKGLAGKVLTFLVALVAALGMVVGFATPAFAATKYVETNTFEQGKNYILVAATVDTGSGYAIQLGASNEGAEGNKSSLPSVKLNITEGSIASVTVDDATLVWNARSVSNSGVKLYCEANVANAALDPSTNQRTHYLYPASQCLKTQDTNPRDIRWQDSQLSVSTTSGTRYYVTCDANGNLGTSSTQSNAATFRLFVEDDGTSDVPVDGITLNQSSMELVEGMVGFLEATVTPDDATDKTVTWSSSDESIAKVDQEGAVQAVSAGDAIITATAGGKSATCAVTVKAEVHDVTWERLAGDGRYDTMAAIVNKGFTSANEAILCTGKNFPDALVAASLAGALDGDVPVILTAPTKLSDQAKELLTNLHVSKVYVLGGSGVVSDDVLGTVKGMGIECERVAGGNRQETSLAVMQKINELGKYDGTVVVATGKKIKDKKGNEKGFADALSIAPWCYTTGTPILLTDKNGKLTDDQIAACEELGVSKLIIVGGKAVVDDEVATQLGFSNYFFVGDVDDFENTYVIGDIDWIRLAGDDRYETSKEIADFELANGMTMTNVTVATGQNFPDALAGAALCGVRNSVMILAKDTKSVGLELIKDNKDYITIGFALGGENAVSADLFSYLESITSHAENR